MKHLSAWDLHCTPLIVLIKDFNPSDEVWAGDDGSMIIGHDPDPEDTMIWELKGTVQDYLDEVAE